MCGTMTLVARSLMRLLPVLLVLLSATTARCDPLALAPRGTMARPDSLVLRALTDAGDGGTSLGWLTVGSPVADLPLEFELAGYDSGGRREGTFGLQYLVTTEAFSDLAPVVSIGVRDVLNTRAEGRAGY